MEMAARVGGFLCGVLGRGGDHRGCRPAGSRQGASTHGPSTGERTTVPLRRRRVGITIPTQTVPLRASTAAADECGSCSAVVEVEVHGRLAAAAHAVASALMLTPPNTSRTLATKIATQLGSTARA